MDGGYERDQSQKAEQRSLDRAAIIALLLISVLLAAGLASKNHRAAGERQVIVHDDDLARPGRRF